MLLHITIKVTQKRNIVKFIRIVQSEYKVKRKYIKKFKFAQAARNSKLETNFLVKNNICKLFISVNCLDHSCCHNDDAKPIAVSRRTSQNILWMHDTRGGNMGGSGHGFLNGSKLVGLGGPANTYWFLMTYKLLMC